MEHIPDPIEIMNNQIERLFDEFDEKHCMNCGKETDTFFPAYDSPTAPAVCEECATINLKRKALIYGKDIPHSVDCSIAFHGFEELDYDIIISNNWLSLNKNDFEQYSVCVGGVDVCRWALSKMGVKNYDIPCYPPQLKSYFSREIEIIKLKDLYKIKTKKFVKPIKPKHFQAFTTENRDNLSKLMGFDDDEQIYVCDIVNFESEWRVYVQNNQIKVICNYKGNPTSFPNTRVIENMIYDFQGPCCYVLDVGILYNSNTALVEFNDFYSIGNYGLFPEIYAEMLIQRWTELKNTTPIKVKL